MLRSKHQRSPTVMGMLLEMRWIGSFPMSDLAIGGGRYGYWLEKRGHWLLVSQALVHPVHPVLYQTTKIPGLAISSHTRHDGTMADPRYPAKTNCAYICTVYIKYNIYIYMHNKYFSHCSQGPISGTKTPTKIFSNTQLASISSE